jgi:dTDP-4-dehydrorhamnose reductase
MSETHLQNQGEPGDRDEDASGEPPDPSAAPRSPSAPPRTAPLELWAGAECTVNRVGNDYFDQLQRTGHDARLDDLERLAELGVHRVRFPILWERAAPERLAEADFSWSDQRLERLMALGIEPIVGLVHHGSGPRYTDLCDDGFAEALAAFAAKVAARYPWVRAYTPVNEPLTTARFSALYGLWYPHARELPAFLRALLHQVCATRASMEAIRRINPGAQLIQTEDLGSTFSVPELDEQSRYENERRWLSLDLLFGRVDARHPLRRHLEEHGVDGYLLDQLSEQPCVPDLLGLNYYVTSDRFLDHRTERYPRHTWGGNGRQTYADVEAVRARPEGIVGHASVLESAWRRYQTPCALTEVHLACYREDQMRWLVEAWRGALAARAKGADVRAITVWSAFGAVGWNNLVTRASGDYEPGAYDVRGPTPRRTALATLAQDLARQKQPSALASGIGWWRSSTRLSYGPASEGPEPGLEKRPSVLVLGSGPFARRIAQLCHRRFDCIVAPTLRSARGVLSRAAESRDVLSREEGGARPWAVILAFDPVRAVPGIGPELNRYWANVRESCAPDVRVLAFSCERVFDGWAARPYVETDPASSTFKDGQSWRAMESAVLDLSPQPLLVRGGFLLDPEDHHEPFGRVLEGLRHGHIPMLDAERVSPTYLPHFVDTALDLLVDGERGIWHLAPRTTCSRLGLVRMVAERLGFPFAARRLQGWRRPERGPMWALASERGWPLPDVHAVVDAYVHHLRSISPASRALHAVPDAS